MWNDGEKDSVAMNNFDGFQICAKRASKKLVEYGYVKDYKTCHNADLVPCGSPSSASELDEIFCVEKGKLDDCPITSVAYLSNTDKEFNDFVSTTVTKKTTPPPSADSSTDSTSATDIKKTTSPPTADSSTDSVSPPDARRLA